MKKPFGRITGERLREHYRLPVAQCLYHKDGKFYEHLTSFPGALCDRDGYILYPTRSAFESDSRIRIGKKVNVPSGVYGHPGYKRFPEPLQQGQFPEAKPQRKGRAMKGFVEL